jgi:hypothetical protein
VRTDLRERFIAFNARYTIGDVRYGGSYVARTFVVAIAVRSAFRSNHFETRAEALAALRRQIAWPGIAPSPSKACCGFDETPPAFLRITLWGCGSGARGHLTVSPGYEIDGMNTSRGGHPCGI